MNIRSELSADEAPIRELLRQAFHPSPAEAQLVDALRLAKKIVLSLVAEETDRILGYVAFSAVTLIPAPSRPIRAVGLAPVAVLPSHQRFGIGSELIRRGIRECRRSGYEWIVVLGSPLYYSRFGFQCARNYGIGNEYGVIEEFMVLELKTKALMGITGTARYEPEFGLFDRNAD